MLSVHASKAATALYAKSMQAEHLGFVLVAYCDLFELRHVVFVVTVWLAVTGVPSFIRDCKGA